MNCRRTVLLFSLWSSLLDSIWILSRRDGDWQNDNCLMVVAYDSGIDTWRLEVDVDVYSMSNLDFNKLSSFAQFSLIHCDLNSTL